uniref:Uncharacterized protein n=1 Tax=Ascaris lumbricoides TaxID=6252 RepID=A0A0M3HLJ6_ASCLU
MLCHDFFFAGDYAEDYSFSQDCGESPAIKVGITEGPLCEVAFFFLFNKKSRKILCLVSYNVFANKVELALSNSR